MVEIPNWQLVRDYLGAKLIDKCHVHLAPPLLSSPSSVFNLRVVRALLRFELHQFRLGYLFG